MRSRLHLVPFAALSPAGETAAVPPVRDIAVFCGSRLGKSPSFAAAAAGLGWALAGRDIGLVYGGASVGLMGVVADAVLGGGGRTLGVITTSLADHEIAHRGLHRLEVVDTMHQRKARMAELSDAVIMLPGGFGTYEEFMETVTWVHLGIHDKPCGVLNTDGFFDLLLPFMERAVDLGFIAPQLVKALVVSSDPDDLVGTLLEAGPN